MIAEGGKRRRLSAAGVWLAAALVLVAVGAIARSWVLPVFFVLFYAALAAFWTRHLRTREHAFMWRHGTTATDTVLVDSSAPEIRSALVAELDRQGRWRIEQNDDAVDAVLGFTWYAFVTKLHVEWHPSGGRLRVLITWRSPQLYDWGAGKRGVQRVIDALQKTSAAER